MVKAQVDTAAEQGHYNATVAGGLKTGALGLGGSLVAGAAAQRYGVRAFTGLTLPLKAFAVTAATTASFIIGADAAARKYELSRYALGSGTELSQIAHRDQQAEQALGLNYDARSRAPTSGLTTTEALVEFGKENRYKVVFGAWAASMVGSFGYISLTPMSFAQKLVQARMVAQGLTVAVLIASAGLSQIPNKAGLSEDDIKQREREQTSYKWKAGSPHDLAQKKLHEEAKAAEQ